MGKLGKKARKFAKKNLQSVLKRNRKTKALFKKKSSKDEQKDVETQEGNAIGPSNGSIMVTDNIEDASIDAVFAEGDKDEGEDGSDSDGYLSEDSSSPYVAENVTGNILEDENASSTYVELNKNIHADLVMKKKKLDRLKKKDPEFSKFLESYYESIQIAETYSDEDERSDPGQQDEDDPAKSEEKPLTDSIISFWCKMVTEKHNQSALISLLNAYRAACHFGAKTIGYKFQNSGGFCNILMFMLSNADDIFRRLFQLSSLNCRKEAIVELKNSSKWKDLRPLVKCYLRSTLFLLNQVTDSEILAFTMTRLRASLLFVAAFPSLLHRLVKATVSLWATGAAVLSSAAFLIIRDVATVFGSNYWNTCVSKISVAYLARSRVSEIVDAKHLQFLRDSIIQLCSLDVQKSSAKALASISQLAKILQWGLQTKKKEAVEKICSWEYVNCIDLWVRFISANVHDYDLRPLMFMTIQIINGLAYMFAGPRYFPLRLKCIQWLSSLSSSSGIFIPVASFVLDVLEYKVVKEGGRSRNTFNVTSVLKLPKFYLKSQSFQEECLLSVIEQLSVHFAQWSCHISFPELAAIPLIRLRKFQEITTTENLRRMVKRFIDQVEQNVDFIQRKRDEVPFSPNDYQSADSFLQLEKSSLQTPFTQYYRGVLEKASQKSLHECGKMSLLEPRKLKRNKVERKKGIAVKENHPADENGILG
ncbi:Noc2p family [Forsythia ovata]|uniref:Noc2p family n=1 Tax=Forsythia ovata TaxID=205694 RepID=A0ABD1WIU1_9LAMI